MTDVSEVTVIVQDDADVTVVVGDGINEVVDLETGPPGDPGSSAYQVAVANGFVGTEAEWLASLVGPPGASGSAYVHHQLVPAATWLVQHNLGMYPSVVVTDSSGQQVYGTAEYLDLNTVQIDFSSAFSGRADLV